MSGREEILATVRANRPKVDRPLPIVPSFDEQPPANLLDMFRDNLILMGGQYLEPPSSGDPLAPARSLFTVEKVVFSAVPEIIGNRDPAKVASPKDLADVDFSIVRAAFAVAETGSVLLSENELLINTSGYLAQHLIVLLDPEDIVFNLHRAYHRREFHERRYAAFHTGPSATADIEGVLIHGAQGVRSLSVLPLRR
jgi:L-lactate dehydrogenase complex protein LldG